MESSSQQQAAHAQPLTLQYTSRSDIRRAIHHIVRRLLLQRLAQQQLDGHAVITITHLSKTDRRRALQQSRLLEDILYKRADTMAEYQDLSTLRERVYKAGRAVYVSARRREMEGVSERRLAAAVVADGAYRAMRGGGGGGG
mmetsp:Transcript_37985/g.62080  ORF Transcript_37985/g.62080 Transcript_37985/m.62080 type:complete len:142 (+) Transcript_37985:278-703(+)